MPSKKYFHKIWPQHNLVCVHGVEHDTNVIWVILCHIVVIEQKWLSCIIAQQRNKQ